MYGQCTEWLNLFFEDVKFSIKSRKLEVREIQPEKIQHSKLNTWCNGFLIGLTREKTFSFNAIASFN